MVLWYFCPFCTLLLWFCFATFIHQELTCYSSVTANKCGNGLDKSLWHYHSTAFCSPTALSLLFNPSIHTIPPLFLPFLLFLLLYLIWRENSLSKILSRWLWFPFAVSKMIFFESLNIPHICHFRYATIFFWPVKGTPKKCVNSRQKLHHDKTA